MTIDIQQLKRQGIQREISREIYQRQQEVHRLLAMSPPHLCCDELQQVREAVKLNLLRPLLEEQLELVAEMERQLKEEQP